jgi:nicotinamide-nucleotide amidase
MELRAEVIAIGDEMVSGQRLDTNSRWLSQRLCELGVPVAFHTTVGDDLADNVAAFRIAVERAEIVVATGGLGPTADDLTRQAIAEAAQVELELHAESIEHIREIFARYSREMPESNRIQAYFPAGSRVIANPEGTAPGIDFDFPREDRIASRVFALPGVPAEMKQMWDATVGPAIRGMTGEEQIIHHHVLNCFGAGESELESMLPNMIARDRNPRVGITASFATISLRVSARDVTVEKCRQQMEPTLREIREILGSLIFGENEQQLQDVVHQQLVGLDQSIAIVDCGLKGDVTRLLISVEDQHRHVVAGGLVLDEAAAARWLQSASYDSMAAARKIRTDFSSDTGVAISEIRPGKSDQRQQFEVAIVSPAGSLVKEFAHAGHSSIRQARSVKQVLNELRLMLQAAEKN